MGEARSPRRPRFYPAARARTSGRAHVGCARPQAGGGVPGNRHLVVPKHTPMCNLMLAMMQAFGIEQTQFGDSTAPLGELMVA